MYGAIWHKKVHASFGGRVGGKKPDFLWTTPVHQISSGRQSKAFARQCFSFTIMLGRFTIASSPNRELQRSACQNMSSFHPLHYNQGLQVLHCRPWMLGSEIENPNGDVWLQYHGNVWFCCGNDFFFRAMLGRFAIASSPNRTACCTTGSAFLRIPCRLTVPCWLCNWWIGRQNHEKIANTIRPGPVWEDFMPHIRF